MQIGLLFTYDVQNDNFFRLKEPKSKEYSHKENKSQITKFENLRPRVGRRPTLSRSPAISHLGFNRRQTHWQVYLPIFVEYFLPSLIQLTYLIRCFPHELFRPLAPYGRDSQNPLNIINTKTVISGLFLNCFNGLIFEETDRARKNSLGFDKFAIGCFDGGLRIQGLRKLSIMFR